MSLQRNLLILCLIIGANSTQAQSPEALTREFIDRMTKENGFDQAALEQLLGQVQVRQPILDAIARPAEKRLAWWEYRRIFLKPERIQGGVDYWEKNAVALQKASEKYGVAPQIMVAIIGVETLYGKRTGGYEVLDALATLGFHYPPRGKFFRSELAHFLLLAREEKIDPTQPTGSYAGAMGYPQFMPSSYRSYAVDFDGDGKRDIWQNDQDAIGSVGNYFARHGWRKGEAITVKAEGVNERHNHMIAAGMKPSLTVKQLRAAGIRFNDMLPQDTATSLIMLENSDGPEHWLGLHNFYVITRYNHSNMYAMAVYQLSQEILALKGAQHSAFKSN